MSGRRFGSHRAVKQAGRTRRDLRLEALERRELLATFTVTNTSDFGVGSLRDAINQANFLGGADKIVFKIAGSGVHTLTPSGPLPAITDAVSIDGTTQPGYVDRPLIEIDGASAGPGANGLRLEAGSVTVKALAINRFSGAGILVDSSSDTFQRNFLGVNPSGTRPAPNGGPGLLINNGSNNLIGGFDATPGVGSDGNVLSGNSGAGLLIQGSGSTQNIITSNYIGTLTGGGGPAGNSGDGIVINGGAFNRIGGQGVGEENVISGNGNNGITIIGQSAQNTNILANFIGVDGSLSAAGGAVSGGNLAIPNGGAGIDIQGGASSTFIGGNDPSLTNIISGNKGPGINVENGPGTQILGNYIGVGGTGSNPIGNLGQGINVNLGDTTNIGGTLAGAANIIAFNGKTGHVGGVNIIAAQQVSILSNSIYSNLGLGITLQSPGGQPVMNDPGDLDQGPNGLQNYPVLTQVATAAGRTLVQGTLDSMPNMTYTVQFFVSPLKDPTNYGQGQTVLDTVKVTTDGNGHAAFSVTVPNPSVIGQFVSSTATDSLGNTSEFSFDSQVTQANQANLAVTLVPSANPGTLGANLSYVVTVTNSGPDPATGVQFNMVLPTGLAFQGTSNVPAGVTITSTGNNVSGDLGTIPPSQSLTFTVIVTPNLVGQSTVTASVFSNEIDPDTSDNSVSQLETIENPADLGLVLTSDPLTVTVGQNVAILAKIFNHGPGTATNVVLQFSLPTNVSFLGASTGQGTTSFNNGVVTARLGTLANGVNPVVRILVTAPNTVPQSGVVSFSGSVSSDEVEPTPPASDPTPNQATLAVPVEPSSDVALTLVANPEPALAGSNLTYTYTIVNNGLSPATGVTLTDTLPANVTFVAAPPPSQGSASVTGGVLTVLVGAMDSGATVTGTLVVTPTLPGLVTDTATVTLDQPDPNLSNNTATFVSTISPVDLSVVISAAPDPVEAGKNLTYTLFVTNKGPASATNVTLNDILPTGVTYVSGVSAQGNVSQLNGSVTALLGTITPGASVPVTIVISPPVTGRLVDTASVFSDQIDTNGADNTATAITYVSPADVGVQLSVSPNTALAGDTITFTAFVTNQGTSAATNVTLADQLPAGLQLVSATTTQGVTATGGSAISAQIGTLVPGASATVTIRAIPSTDGTYTDSASVTADQVDPNLANNIGQATINVTNGPGVILFSAPSYTVGENAGQAVITLTRVSGNSGFVTVDFRTTAGTAVAGTNYSSTAGTLTFNPGDITKSFTIPVLADGIVNGATSVGISLSNPTGGATLGSSAAATLVIAETDFDVTGPEIADVQTQGSGKFVTGVTLVFTEALDPLRAVDPNNYSLYAPNKHGGGLSLVAFQPTYNASNHTVTLTASRALPLNTFFTVVVNGSSPTGVADIYDNRIRGTNGANGQDFVASFARGSSLRYTDHDGDLVSLNMSNGGLLDLYRSANGEGQVLRVLGAGSRRSVLTGNVRKGPFNSDGVTTFQTIIGANFGQVDSHLTTPKFYVNTVTAFIRGSASNVARTAFVAAPATRTQHASTLFARQFVRRFTH